MVHVQHIEEHRGRPRVHLDIGPQVVGGDEDQDLLQRAARIASAEGKECIRQVRWRVRDRDIES